MPRSHFRPDQQTDARTLKTSTVPSQAALPAHQLGLADGYFAPGVCPIALVFKNQRFEVQVLVLDLPSNGCDASSPLIRLKQERWWKRIHDDFHIWFDRRLERWRDLAVVRKRLHGKPEFAIVRRAECECWMIRKCLALPLPVVAVILRN